jgi:hypothetical protein
VSIKSEREHPQWWVRTGHSQYGKQFDRGGIAWWCPPCYHEKEKYTPQFVIEEKVIITPIIPPPDLVFKVANFLLNRGLIADQVSTDDLERALTEILEAELAANC